MGQVYKDLLKKYNILLEEKITFFRSLFKGRDDVFARHWYSKATNKSGYQPVCENEWNEEFCEKKKYKCSVCTNRKLMANTNASPLKGAKDATKSRS